ncbi:MAG: HAMP domain-containing sensor histidine kinase [Myxococcota bacterium]
MAPLERRLGVDLRRDPGPAAGPPQSPFGPASWARSLRGERIVYTRRGPGNEVAVWSGQGWLVAHDPFGPPPEWRLAGALLAGGLAIGLGATAVAAAALRPVDAARRAMAQVADGDLAHRLDPTRGPPELRQMAATFNRMAEEVERRVRLERERLAALSHELRTPLTRMRLEVDSRGGPGSTATGSRRSRARWSRWTRSSASSWRCRGSSSGTRRSSASRCRCASSWPTSTSTCAETACCGSIAAWCGAPSTTWCATRRHAPGARITVTALPDGLAVADDGPGVPAEDLPRLFEPFFRSATEAEGHGLGLAIVRQIARLHGGDAAAAAGPGLRITLRLPP